MSRLGKFLRLPAAERRLLCGTALLLGATGLGLRVLSFYTVRRLLHRLGRLAARTRLPADRIAWAVTAAGRNIPGAGNCLVQALAAETLLRRHGHRAELRIGVARAAAQPFQAHAWVECDGRAFLGGTELGGFSALPPLRLDGS